MAPGYYLAVFLFILFRAQGEQVSYDGDSSVNFTSTCFNGCDNDDNALQGSACSNECVAPRGIEEPDDSDEEILEDDDEDAYGLLQVRDTKYKEEIEQTMLNMKVYFHDLRSNPNTTSNMLTLLDNCKNEHENCAFWQVIGECEKVS